MVLLRGETYSLLNIEEFLISNHFTNTSLSVVNQGVKSSIRVHSLVLASISPFLKELLLMGLPHQDEEILLTGVSHEELQSLVQFLYTGFVDLPSREFYNSFLGLLQSLNIKLDQLRMEELLAPSTLLNSREDALSSEEDLWVLKDQGNVLTTLDDSEILYEFPIKLDESSGITVTNNFYFH
ncbi:uncharacterized protein [Lepeophtheirus salmonis]|uniref:uncharacterized protein n=1 Tax=Lepeophtheirus salmonis TaxID=72036 RepID=UPI001AE249FA|nr:modifier of mdg4-like isoform X1 [Lepeophtheirus salmonis]